MTLAVAALPAATNPTADLGDRRDGHQMVHRRGDALYRRGLAGGDRHRELERRWGSTVQQDAMAYAFSSAVDWLVGDAGRIAERKSCNASSACRKCPTPSWIAASVVGTLAASITCRLIRPRRLDSSIVLPGRSRRRRGSSDQLQHPDRRGAFAASTASPGTLGILDDGGNVVFGRMIDDLSAR